MDWASVASHPAGKKKLTAILRLADNDPWRQQLFNALDAKDWPGSRQARQPEALGQPPACLVEIGDVLAQNDLPAAVDFLRKAQQRHTGDFWLNDVLGL